MMLVVDDTGDEKSSHDAAGAARQYSVALGRVTHGAYREEAPVSPFVHVSGGLRNRIQRAEYEAADVKVRGVRIHYRTSLILKQDLRPE